MSSIFSIFSIPLGWLMRGIYDLVGNYGVTLILFTLLTKIILLPLSIKQKKSTIRMSVFSPLIQQIQKKYASDPQKQQEELARLQQEHNFSMTSGCAPMLIQFPILIGLINVIYKPLQYIARVPADVIKTITPIAEGVMGSVSRYSRETSIIVAVKQNPDMFSQYLSAEQLSFVKNFNFTFLGFDLSVTPSIKNLNVLVLIPIISVIVMLIQQFVTMKLNGQKMEGPAKFMPIYTSVMFRYFGFVVPAGVSVYWIFNSVFGILQEYILSIFFDVEKERAKINREVEEARKKRKEERKKRPEKAKKAIRQDKEKYAEESKSFDGDMTEEQRKRLEKARALDREKYGDK